MNKSYQNFKKRVGKLAVTFALVGTTAAGGMAVATDSVDAATVKSGYTSTTVTLRKSASTKSAKLATIKKGAKVTILKTSGKWLKVKYDGKTGYVYKTYVKKTFTTKDYSGKFKLKTDLNVRKGPGTSFVKAGTLKKGTVVTVKGKTSNGWYTITYKGSTRYISASSKYLTKYVAPTPKPEKNNAPTISVNDTYTLVKGEDFDYSMLKATASDKEDGDLTSKIDFSGVVNTGKVGEYTVKLTVKDSKGATATKTVKVIVKKADTNTPPVIAVDSIHYVKQNGTFTYEDLKATAFDKEDSKEVEIKYSGVVNTKEVGEYKVTLIAVDSDKNEAKKEVTVVVVRNVPPVITCKYDNDKNPYQVAQYKEFKLSDLGATASDFEDGDNLTINYTITDKNGKTVDSVDTKIDENKIAKDWYYLVKMTATDSNGAKAEKTVKVSVVKDNAPVIKFYKEDGKTEVKNPTYKIESGDTLDLSDANLKKIFNVKADDGEGNDITANINVLDAEKVNLNVKSDKDVHYTIKFQVTDNGVGCVKKADIIVKKNNPPEVTIKNATKDDTTGKYAYNKVVKLNGTFDYSMLGAEAKDYHALDTDKKNGKDCTITYKGTVDTTISGDHTVKVIATDAKGAETVETVIVTVEDYKDNNQAPVINHNITNNTIELKFEADKVGEYALGTTKEEQEDALEQYIKATVSDDLDKDIKVTYALSQKIDTTAIGAEYTVTLTAKDKGDSQGNNIKEATPVTITIKIVK